MSTFSMNGSPTCTEGSFLRPGAPLSSPPNVSDASTDTPPMPSRPVRAPNRMILLPVPDANARCRSSLRSTPDAERVDQRVARIGGVEHGLTADVRQAERVAVPADAADDAVDDAAGVGCVGRAEPQLVHHRHRAGAHGHDVAHDAADTGGRALIGLDVGRVVVGLHLEGGRPSVADVHHAGVLTDARQQSLRASPRWWSRRSSAGAPSRTCRSSARSTSPNTSPVRRRWACGRGSRGSAGTRRP